MSELEIVDDLGTGDVKRVRKAKKKADYNDRLMAEYWRQVLETPAGRAVVYETLEKCHVFSRISAGEQTHITAHREGKRDIGIDLFERILQVAPQSYTLMRQEALKRNETRED